MKSRNVLFSPEAEEDILQIYDWIAAAAGANAAFAYVSRIERKCQSLDLASNRGQARDDIRPGLRIIGFERRATIAFIVASDRVTIVRIFAGGQDWECELRIVEVKSGRYSDYTPKEINEFKALVTSEGRVNADTLDGLLGHAKRLVLLFDIDGIIGTAAIKAPNDHYRGNVFRKASLIGSEAGYPSELGWVVVHPDHRGKGYSRRLVEEALANLGEGVYATSQDRDHAMHHTLERCGFRKSGDPYQSRENPDSKILLFLR